MDMTRDDIISMAFDYTVGGLEFDEEGLLRFVNIITAAEREACAVICENDEDYSNGDVNYHSTLIRARGK